MDIKKIFILLIFSIVLFSVVVKANGVTVDFDKRYSISSPSISQNRAVFIVNNKTTKYLSKQDSPYQFYPYYNAEKIGNLNLIVSNIIYNSKDTGPRSKVEVILAYRVNISEENSLVKINLNGTEYNISLSLISSDRAVFIVNNKTTKYLSKQDSPYQFYPYYNAEKIGNLNLIVSNIIYNSKDTGPRSKVEVILAYNVTISEDCVEDWSCTTWSPCSNNQQTRKCTDTSSCGTTKNKPIETKSCSSPYLPVTCYSDNECKPNKTTSSYCMGNDVCIIFKNYTCKNSGTEKSYCTYSESLNCTTCENGCENAKCIIKNSPSNPPQKKSQKECEQIGLRTDWAYCSPQYKIVRQKSNGSPCNNNFECRSNICQNGECKGNKSHNLIYWIVGLVLLLIIIGIIFYFSKKRLKSSNPGISFR